ncbi:unnamed protein product [Ambrosiozyma monospora]|uniref:Unnamed protein product n=1 Tax=Ambrosiozyma monospora TaxID=43982 RepID=A0A9W6T921_AMBMO|nr:unnamed protein product [Ambrosiozyma monospora]
MEQEQYEYGAGASGTADEAGTRSKMEQEQVVQQMKQERGRINRNKLCRGWKAGLGRKWSRNKWCRSWRKNKSKMEQEQVVQQMK